MTPHATLSMDEELAAEREHLAVSRAALRRMREHAQALYATGEDVAGDAYSAESLGRTLARRVAELADDPTVPLFFGKLELADERRPTGPAQLPAHDERRPTGPAQLPAHDEARYHIGRRHVTDDRGEPLVLDWRAPLSRAFYRASVRDRQGVAVRRRFGFSAGLLTSFEDEHLDRGEELGTASRILTQEIERPRVGPMRDIVATIQPEQDELVRAAIEDSVCVQGAPGTGKTAVGLHRAAYLLYVHRERLRRSGVLIIGPNRAFLHYIAAVLPALGELDVTQSTVDDLLATPVRGTDDAEAQLLKHDGRMADVLARALSRYVRKPTRPIVVSDGSYRWRLSEDVLRRVVDDVRRERPPHAIGRERVRARVVGLLQRQAEARSGESPGEAWVRRMGRSAPVTGFLDEAWPAVTPEALVFALLTDPSAAAAGILTGDEQAAIRWAKPPRSVKTAKWTAADAVLIDEAAGLIDRLPSFGHVVVDEAQDLSPMQLRAISRRCEHGSVTLLGDLAQGTAPWAATDWAATLAHLGKPGTPVVPLTIGFRVPEAVVDLANRLLPALGVAVPEARSLRRDGWLRLARVEDLVAATVTEVLSALEQDGSVGVIAADAAVPALTAALRAAGVDAGTAEEEERVTVLPATLAKGLEYDHVVVVEPAAIVAAEPRGLHRLYVVLTRAVSRLAVLHRDPLPAPLRP
jgi:DNA helicase IV